MIEIPAWLQSVLVSVFSAGAIYGGIRADLRTLHEKVASAAKSASRAHERIDNHLEQAK